MLKVTGVLQRHTQLLILLGATAGAVLAGLQLVRILSSDQEVYIVLGLVDLVLSFVFYPFGILQFVFLSLIGGPAFGQEVEFTAVKLLGFVVAFRRLVDLMGGTRLRIASVPTVKWAALFVLSLSISLVSSRDIWESLAHVLTYVQLLIMLVLVIEFVRSERQLAWLLPVFVLSGLANTGFALYEFYVEGAARVYGMVENANRFGMLQLTLLALILPTIGSLASRWRSLLALAVSGLIGYSLLLSLSRGTFIAATGVILYYFLFLRVGGFRRKVVIALAVMVALWIAPETFYRRVEMIPNLLSGVPYRLDSSSETRLTYARAGIRMGMDHPLTGVGLSQFNAHLWSYTHLPRIHASAHNMYISVFAEAGAISVVLFLALLVSSLRSARSYRTPAWVGSRFVTAMAMGVELGLVSLLIGGLWGTLEYSKATWMMFAFAVAVREMGMQKIGSNGT